MEKLSSRNVSIVAGILFLIVFFLKFTSWIQIIRALTGLFNYLTIDFFVLITKITLGAFVFLFMGVFCLIGNNKYRFIATIIMAICIVLNYFSLTGIGIFFILPVLCMVVFLIPQINNKIQESENKIIKYLWLMPLILIVPYLIGLVTNEAAFSTYILALAYAIGCSFVILWEKIDTEIVVEQEIATVEVISLNEVKEDQPSVTKYCSICGNEIHKNAVICPNCGCAVVGTLAANDTPSMGLNILSLLIPIAGLILFCANIGTKPISAKSYGVWALIGVLICVVLTICTIMIL